MFTLLDFVAVIFASAAIIEVWHKGSIFEDLRAWSQTAQDTADPRTTRGRLLELLNCPFCKSYHIPFYLYLAYWLSTIDPSGVCSTFIKMCVYSLAATRIGNIVDMLLPPDKQYNPNLKDYDI